MEQNQKFGHNNNMTPTPSDDTTSSPSWIPFDSHREMKVLQDGKILVLRPISNSQPPVPLFCPLCKFPMKTSLDSIAFRSSGKCCDKCFLFCKGEPTKVSPESWSDYITNRTILSKPSFRFV